MNQIDKLLTPPTEIEIAMLMYSGGDTARRLVLQRDRLLSKVKELRDLIRRLLAKLPYETRDLSVGWCAGCHAVQWCGDGQGAEPYAPDCVLQEAIAAVGEK